VPYKDDIYKKHIEFIKKHFDIGKNIIDNNDKIIAELCKIL
jgi:hypothetical protein